MNINYNKLVKINTNKEDITQKFTGLIFENSCLNEI